MRPAGSAARMVMLLVASAGMAAGQEPTAELKAFDTATIKPSRVTDGSWGMRFTANGFTARGVGLSLLLEEAYGFDWYSYRVSILPKGWSNRLFDVEAGMDGANQAMFAKLNADEQRVLLRRLLKDRFKLGVTQETEVREAFLLQQQGKSGAHLEAPLFETEEEKLKPGLVRQSGPGVLVVERLTMEGLARVIKDTVRRMVVDRTGLPGRYGFALHWAPEGTESAEWPDLPTALQEQLGLRLVAAKISVPVVVVSAVEEPSGN